MLNNDVDRPWRDLTDPRRAASVEDLEAGLKEPVFENLEIPEEFGPVRIRVDDYKIKRFCFTQDTYSSWYLSEGPVDGRRIGQPCLLANDLLQLFTLKYRASETVGFHTEEQIWFTNPVFIDETVTLSGKYTEAYERRGQGYVVMEATAAGEDGRHLIRHRGVEILRAVPGELAGRGSSKPDKRVTGEVPDGAPFSTTLGKDSKAGHALEPVEKVITAEQAAVFSRIGEYVFSTHTDIRIARENKLRVPMVQGQQQVGILGEYLAAAFGVDWFFSGWLRVKFINPLEVFEPIRLGGLVTQVQQSKDGRKILDLEVWIRRESDQKLTCVGWASCSVPT